MQMRSSFREGIMTELIDPKALKQYIDDCKVCDHCPDKNMRCYDGCELPDFLTKQWERIIDEQPIIEAEPVRHGKWIPCAKSGLVLTELMRKEGLKWYGFKCSVCNFIRKGNALTEANYCEHCGARMDGEGE